MWIYSDNIVSCLSFKIVAGVWLPTALAWRPEHELHCHCEYEDKKHLFRTHFPNVHVIWELYFPSALWPEMQIHGFVFFFVFFLVLMSLVSSRQILISPITLQKFWSKQKIFFKKYFYGSRIFCSSLTVRNQFLSDCLCWPKNTQLLRSYARVYPLCNSAIPNFR